MSLRLYLDSGETASAECMKLGLKVLTDARNRRYVETGDHPLDPMSVLRQVEPQLVRQATYQCLLGSKPERPVGVYQDGESEVLVQMIPHQMDVAYEVRAASRNLRGLREIFYKIDRNEIQIRRLPELLKAF